VERIGDAFHFGGGRAVVDDDDVVGRRLELSELSEQREDSLRVVPAQYDRDDFATIV